MTEHSASCYGDQAMNNFLMSGRAGNVRRITFREPKASL